jgi:hypothetical protein
MTLIEFRNRGAIKECKPVKVCQNIRGLVVLPGQPRESEHGPTLKFRFSAIPADEVAASDYLPSKALMPSHIAPTKPVTMIVITALTV